MKFFFLRELKKHPRFASIFISVLGLGLSGFLLVEALRVSVAKSLSAESRSILAADLAVSIRRPFQPEEIQVIQSAVGDLPKTQTIEFFSMLGQGEEARLVLVKAVQSNYPLVGELTSRPPILGKIGKQLETRAVLLSADTLPDLPIGSSLQLGSDSFKLKNRIVEDPTQSFSSFALGGRAYLHEKFVTLQPGSTATYSLLILCPSESDAEQIKLKIEKVLPNPEIRITTAKESAENSTQALAYMGDFLGLVSLIALLLSSLGAAYLYRSHLDHRKYEIAIYRALGLSLKTIQWHVASQTIILALLALIPASLLSSLLLPILEKAINLWSHVKVDLQLHLLAFVPLLLITIIGTPLLLLPELLALKRFTPLALFREDSSENSARPWLHYLPALLFFAALTPLVARSYRNAGIFIALLIALAFVLLLVLRFFSKILKLKTKSWRIHHAFLFLSRKRRSAATVFLTLALGSLLLHLLPQLEVSIRSELETPTRLPSLFFFDIQAEQKISLETELATLGHKFTSISPLVRARILTVNGKSFERIIDSSSFKTREEEQEVRFRNRGVNLSFRNFFQESETLVRGNPFSGSEKIPALSVETRFAKRMGLNLGDILRFDVQGVEIEGEIVNERRVRWTSFQPNFFLVFQEGVLEDAPKTYLANLSALTKTEKTKIQTLLAHKFPNISVIDVAAIITKILDLLGRMRLALLLLAALALSAGFSVLASVLSLEARERGKSLVLYRTLGASESDLRYILFTESLVLSSLAIVCGAAGSLAFTYVLTRFIFDGAFAINFLSLISFSVLLLTVSLFTSWIASRALVRQTPLEILRQQKIY